MGSCCYEKVALNPEHYKQAFGVNWSISTLGCDDFSNEESVTCAYELVISD